MPVAFIFLIDSFIFIGFDSHPFLFSFEGMDAIRERAIGKV